MHEVLRVSNLGRAFDNTKVLDGVGFALNHGERLAVLGPSGSGKTTLLRLIAGLEAPTEGDIFIAGKAASQSGGVLIAPEHREVALVFQGLALFPHLRALDQIAFAARGRGGIDSAKSLLDRVGLRHRANARLDELSGGERQRIALARALAQKPKLILMDEPFASLDDEKRLRDAGSSPVAPRKLRDNTRIGDAFRDDAFDLARRVIVLERGQAVVDDMLEAILVRPQHVAAVRALGLGQVMPGEVAAEGDAETAFGKVRTPVGTTTGPALLLVRPDQPCIVADGTGVEADVLSLELRPPEGREIRRVAVVQSAGKLLRVFARSETLTVGERVRVRIEGECEPVQGNGDNSG